MSEWSDDDIITLLKSVRDGQISVAEAADKYLCGTPRELPSRSECDRLDIQAIFKRLPPRNWDKPKQLGEDGWFILGNGCGIIVTFDSTTEVDVDWVHASISYQERNRFPSYGDLVMLHQAVFGDGHAYQCFVPPDEHISITKNVLHLWGRADGKPALPDFGRLGTI